ncbi:hypothetical protein V5799_004016 [Amblyomma americanum]|uniref:Serine aminopeptidase S33 domain-containing protein n=1 Tax=Amblyomma americanum TaxID=6943 RepID=A0AAQ4D7B2_AMBAM
MAAVEAQRFAAAPKAPEAGEGDQEDNEGDAKAAAAAARETRATWGTQAQLFLACLGLSMGLANFWRIPTLLYDNGGIAFLVPYVLFSLTVAKPVLFMELFLGQFSSQGSVGIWRCVPIGKADSWRTTLCPAGIGLCMCIVSVLMSVYFMCFMAHAMMFAWNSLTTELPWAVCSDRWGADAGCYIPRPGVVLYVTSGVPYTLLTLLLMHGMSMRNADVGILRLLSPNWQKLLDYRMSVAGGTAATTGAGDTAAGASPKPAAANGAHEAVLTAGAPTVGATAVESQPVNEDVIRRLSSTLGRTPNELRRMEAVLNRRMSTVPVTEQGMAAAASVPREAAKLEKEASTKKVSPPSTPPKLEIEHLPPEGYEVPVMGNFGPAWMPVNALTSPASYTQGAQGPMPAWGPTQALPAEFAGLEGQFASAAGANQPYAPQISVAPAGKPSVVVGQPMLPAGMLPAGLPQQASASLPPTGAVPLPGHRDDTGTMSPLKSALRSNERPISRGHIVINAPAAPTGPVGSGTFGDFARRQSTIQGPPVVSYSEFLRRPSVKLTLLEPIDSAGPEQEQQVQEQDFIAKLNTIEVPMFVLVASDDRVCDVGAMKQFFDSVPSKHKKIKIYEGSYHQILAEPEGIKEQAFMDIAEWFKESLYRAKVQHSYSQSSWTSDPSCTSPSVLSN